ncbi:MAG: hypothetical protein KJO21_02065 [Verrucomicrobiae bacterium]|nr:hypothetical protein [Verrucomicrobiae bacterium]NNJ44084.1 hypothetical protein [Akkermansiaceae bacterium]
MKTTLMTTLAACALLGLSITSSWAEGKGGGNGLLRAAESYAKQGQMAQKAGNLKDAAIYFKLSQMKKDAASAAANGESYDWSHYSKLRAELSGKKNAGKKNAGKKKNGGLNAAAERYAKMAGKAKAAGNHEHAQIYGRLSQIKRDAAAHKGPGSFDWSEYSKLKKALYSGKKTAKDKGAHLGGLVKKPKKSTGNGFLDSAARYTEKANAAMQAGDEKRAMIYTQMAGMKREAAAASKQGKAYDWTAYFALKKQLK